MCKCARSFDPCETELRERIRRAAATIGERGWTPDELCALVGLLETMVDTVDAVEQLSGDVINVAFGRTR